ncbi:hypothetical protein MAR_020927, partial [Mya arenaria]
MMPPLFVFPDPKPGGYNPLTGSTEGSDIAYTKKGWMNALTFSKFIDHFDKHAGTERPVTLLFDSVSSHIDISVFTIAKLKEIELHRIDPNATQLMQPLDKAEKTQGEAQIENTSQKKLTEAFLLFYKPPTVINAFKSSGIYPVDSSAISSEALKPALL